MKASLSSLAKSAYGKTRATPLTLQKAVGIGFAPFMADWVPTEYSHVVTKRPKANAPFPPAFSCAGETLISAGQLTAGFKGA